MLNHYQEGVALTNLLHIRILVLVELVHMFYFSLP